jgi:hypothetical protein
MPVAVAVVLTASHTAPTVSIRVRAGSAAVEGVGLVLIPHRLQRQGNPTQVVEVVALLGEHLEVQGAQGW